MRIYLVGYMGSGKSTLGRRLATFLEWSFVDLDKYIEERQYRSVQQIFATDGEDAFRRFERKALEEVSDFDKVVVATGGGAPCFFDNMELMNQTGITIFLDLPPEILMKRLVRSKNVRPLIKGKSGKELEEFISSGLTKRRSFYERAAFTINRPDTPVEEISQLVGGVLNG